MAASPREYYQATEYRRSMPYLIHQHIARGAEQRPDATALLFRDQTISYEALWRQVQGVAAGLVALGIGPGERVAVYLPKQPETVYGLFGAAAAGACFVPVNPLLKPRQVEYILRHCGARALITSWDRLDALAEVLRDCDELQTIVCTDDRPAQTEPVLAQQVQDFSDLGADNAGTPCHNRIDTDMAAILYTSGSTGRPKGVVLSHRNLVVGAECVAQYLSNTEDDRLLAVLPLSFDAGLSQLTSAFSVGASVVLMDYLLPRDVLRAIARYQVSGLGAVPPLWNQLCDLPWPEEAVRRLRYITNTGGAMPLATTRALRGALPDTEIFLMYGLTEAFRSTYLPPDQVDHRPDSIGRAVPDAEILVINEEGRECAPHEAGELVHRGALVSMGYWRDPEKTAERFKPCPGAPPEIMVTEPAVWSGDRVKKDEEGYLYFLGRQDDMIKTSGYRVSPTEIEEVLFESGIVQQSVALGLPHTMLGQAILVLASAAAEIDSDELEQALMTHCRRELPNYMVPAAIIRCDDLPRNQNGKIDRAALSAQYKQHFVGGTPG